MNLSTTAQRVLEAVLNGGFQGIVLTLGVALLLRCVPRINAATRHAVWLACLGMVALLPALHFAVAFRTGDADVATTEFGMGQGGGEAQGDAAGAVPGDSTAMEMVHWESIPVDSPLLEPPAPAVEPAFGRAEPVVTGIDTAGALETSPAVSSAWAGSLREAGRLLSHRWSIAVPAAASVVAVLLWMLVAGYRLGRLALECLALREIKRNARAADADAVAWFRRIADGMSVTRPVELRVGPEVAIPLVAGFRHPAVMLPEGFLEANSRDQISQVLRHELAHVHRWDDWSNLVQQGIQAVLFFHPAVRWISGRLALDREIACDDHVLDATHQARTYALLLTDFAGRHRGRDLLVAPAVWNRRTQLKERIAMILDSKRNSSPRLGGTLAGVLILAIAGITGIVLQAAPRVTLAEAQAPEETGAEAGLAIAAVAERTELTPPGGPVPLGVRFSEDATPPRLKEPPAPAGVPAPPEPPASPVPPPSSPDVEVDAPVAITIRRSETSSAPSHSGKPVKKEIRIEESRTVTKRDTSLEKRLDRLEKMIERLASERGLSSSDVPPVGGALATVSDPHALQALVQLSEETRARAERDAHKAAAEAQKAVREMQYTTAVRTQLDLGRVESARQHLEEQRRSLEAAREKLQQELEGVQRRIEKLEAEREDLGERELSDLKRGSRKKVRESSERRDSADDTAPADPTKP